MGVCVKCGTDGIPIPDLSEAVMASVVGGLTCVADHPDCPAPPNAVEFLDGKLYVADRDPKIQWEDTADASISGNDPDFQGMGPLVDPAFGGIGTWSFTDLSVQSASVQNTDACQSIIATIHIGSCYSEQKVWFTTFTDYSAVYGWVELTGDVVEGPTRHFQDRHENSQAGGTFRHSFETFGGGWVRIVQLDPGDSVTVRSFMSTEGDVGGSGDVQVSSGKIVIKTEVIET